MRILATISSLFLPLASFAGSPEQMTFDSSIEKIEIQNLNGAIELISEAGQNGKIVYEKKDPILFSQKCKLTIQQSKDTLKIEVKKKTGTFNEKACESKFQVYVTSNNKLKISQNSGNLKTEGQIKELDAKVNAGKILTQGQIHKGSFKVQSGEVQLKLSEIKDLEVKVKAGKCSIDADSFREESDLKCELGTGTIELSSQYTLPKKGKIEAKINVGSITLSVPQNSQMDYKNYQKSGSFQTQIPENESSDFIVKTEIKNGNVKILKNNQENFS